MNHDKNDYNHSHSECSEKFLTWSRCKYEKRYKQSSKKVTILGSRTEL